MQAIKRPVIPLVLSQMVGIGLGAHLAGGFAVALVASVFSGAVILWQCLRSKAALLAPIILMGALGYLSILPWVAPRFTPQHVIHHLQTGPVTLIGEVDSRPRRQFGRTKFILNSHGLRRGQALAKAAGKVRVTLSGDAPRLEIGQRLELSGRLRALKNFQNPGGFDFKRQMAYQQIWASLYTSDERVKLVAAANRPGLSVGLDRIRRQAARQIASHADGAPAAVLKALLIGDRSQITPQLRQLFSRAGVSHILAISGLHIGIVAAVAFALFRWGLCQFRLVLLRGWSRKGAAGLTLVPVLAYGLMAGMSPSTQRAVLMAVVFLAAFWVERELDTFSSLAAAAWIILIVNPPSLFSISFQLSFAAVFAILFGLDRIRPRLQRSLDAEGLGKVLPRLRRFGTGMVTVSLLAIWGTLPLTMTYFNQICFVGVIANLVVVPVIGFCVVPLGLAALVVWPLSAAVSGAMVALAAWLLSLVLPVIELLGKLPLAALTTWTPTALEIACFFLISGCALVLVTQAGGRRRKSSAVDGDDRSGVGGPCRRRHRPMAALANWWARRGPQRLLWLVLTLSLLVAGADALYWLNQRFWHRDLKITILDVAHGNAALVEFPGGHTMLIDGGGFGDISAFDLGERVLAPLLRRRKILTVDTLVLSPPNSDHMNGLIYIASNFNVKQLWTNGEARATLGYRLLMAAAAAKRVQTPDFVSLARHRSVGGVQVRLIYPPADFLSKRAVDRWRDTNNNSLVVQLVFGEHSFLFPGDITRRAEAELVARCGSAAQSTVLIVPHHGSKSSSSPAFLSAVAPRIAIVSARDRGKHLHPHPTVVERFRGRQCRLYQTEIQGAIRLISDGHALKVEPFVAAPAS